MNHLPFLTRAVFIFGLRQPHLGGTSFWVVHSISALITNYKIAANAGTKNRSLPGAPWIRAAIRSVLHYSRKSLNSTRFNPEVLQSPSPVEKQNAVKAADVFGAFSLRL